jgi:hypothetical protein
MLHLFFRHGRFLICGLSKFPRATCVNEGKGATGGVTLFSPSLLLWVPAGDSTLGMFME